MSSLHNELLKIDFLLPKTVVDPYGLHSEESTLKKQYLPSLINLSIQIYEKFRISLNDFTSSIANYIGQCSDVIIARNFRKPIETVTNWHLPGFNLYTAAKKCSIMQYEFRKLFLLYTDSSYKDFENKERHIFELTINVWQKLINTPVIVKKALSYSVRQIVTGTERKIYEGFNKIINSEKWSINVNDITDSNGITKRYLLYNFDISKGNPIEWYFKELCVDLREIWKDAKDYNGYRLYLDTIWPEMVFVPLYMGVPLLSAFSIPIYRILDIPEEKIDSLLIPVEIPEELDQNDIHENEVFIQWRQAFPELAKLRMLIIQYKQLINTVNDDSLSIVESGLKEWSSDWSNEVTNTLSSIMEKSKEGFERIACLKNEEALEGFNYVIESLNEFVKKIEILEQIQTVDEVLKCLENVMLGMIFLSPYIIKND